MDKSNVTLERMRTFVRVAERGSLSAVAREIGAGQSTITRQLKELEEAVGVPLLARTTRRVTMTDEGQRYYATCINILRLVDQAGDEARSMREAPSGNVRISCTSALGVMHVSKMIFAFQDAYPLISVDLSLSDERIDLVKEGVDIAVRLGPLSDSSMKLHAVGMSRRLLVAAPSYFQNNVRPEVPSDIANLQMIRMANIAGSEILELTGPKGEHHRVKSAARLQVDHGLAARQALIAGRGIALAHHWLVADLLKSGTLEEILSDYELPPVQLNTLIAPERSNVTRVRLAVDYLVEHLRSVPGIA